MEPVKTAIWSTSLAWVLALFNFIHVGFESGIGGWLGFLVVSRLALLVDRVGFLLANWLTVLR